MIVFLFFFLVRSEKGVWFFFIRGVLNLYKILFRNFLVIVVE